MLQVKLPSCPQHRASCTVTFWDEWSSLVLGTTQVGALLSSANSKVTVERHRDQLRDKLPAFLALPRSPAPGSPRAPLSRRSPRPQASARLSPAWATAVSSSRLAPLVPPTRPPRALQLGRARLAPPIGGLLSPLPAPPMRGGRATGLVALR